MTEIAGENRSTTEVLTIEGAPEGLQLQILDGLVGHKENIRREFESQSESTDFESFKYQKITELLAEHGFTDGGDDNDRRDYELARSLYESIIALNETDWLTREDGTDMPRRNRVFEQLLDAYYSPSNAHDDDETDDSEAGEAGDETEASSSETEDENGETSSSGATGGAEGETGASDDDIDMDSLHEEALAQNERFDLIGAARVSLNGARSLWSTMSAKRQGRVLGKGKNHDAVRDDYQAKLRALGILELNDQINESDDEATRNAKVIAYLFEEQRRLREQTTEKLQNTKVGKFVRFMNKGNVGVRIAKGIGLGLIAGAGGALIIGAILPASAGAALAATGAVAGSRFVKGYASNDRHRGMQTAQESFIDAGGNRVHLEASDGPSIEDKFDSAANVYNEDFETDTVNEQVKRRKAFAVGAGSVAIGASLGYAISNADEIKQAGGSVYDKVSGWFGNSDAVKNGSGKTSLASIHDMDDDGTRNGVDTDIDGDGVANADDLAPRNPDVTGIDFSEISREARWIEHGEGGYQTLQELGVPQEKWDAVWAEAGEKFHESGKTYVMDDGKFGWSEPGRMSNEDITELIRAARHQGVALDFELAA